MDPSGAFEHDGLGAFGTQGFPKGEEGGYSDDGTGDWDVIMQPHPSTLQPDTDEEDFFSNLHLQDQTQLPFQCSASITGHRQHFK